MVGSRKAGADSGVLEGGRAGEILPTPRIRVASFARKISAT